MPNFEPDRIRCLDLDGMDFESSMIRFVGPNRLSLQICSFKVLPFVMVWNIYRYDKSIAI